VLTEHPVDTNVSKGHSFQLSCSANGYPIPNIVWYLNGTEIELGNNSLMFSNDSIPEVVVSEIFATRSIQSLLNVSMAMTNDSGTYFCLVTSQVMEYSALPTRGALVLVQGKCDDSSSEPDYDSSMQMSLIFLIHWPHCLPLTQAYN